MSRKMTDTDLVAAVQCNVGRELIDLINSEITPLETHRSSVAMYEVTKAVLRQPPGTEFVNCWIKIFESLYLQRRTKLQTRLSDIKRYVKNGDRTDFSREIPFIQWAFLDQAPISDPKNLEQHLVLARQAFSVVSKNSSNNYAPYFHLTGIWLGQESNKKMSSSDLRSFCLLPISLACSFLENLTINNFNNSNFRGILEDGLLKSGKKNYWSYFLKITDINPRELYFLKPSLISKLLPKRDLFHEIIEKDDSHFGNIVRKMCTPKIKENKKQEEMLITSKPRIAVVISGQMRNYRYAWLSQRELVQNIGADVYVSTWSNTGRKAPDNPEHAFRVLHGEALRQFRTSWAELGNEEFHRRYEPVFNNTSNRTITVEEISAHYGITPERICLDPDKDLTNNSEKMYYRWQRAMNVFDFASYDLILRVRPDSTFEMGTDFRSEIKSFFPKNQCALYVDQFANTFHRIGIVCGDSVAVGHANLMLRYLNTLNNHKISPFPIFGRPSKFVAHANLAWNLNSKGIEIRKLPWNTGIAHPDSSAEKDFIEEFKKVLENRVQGGISDVHDESLQRAIMLTYSSQD